MKKTIWVLAACFGLVWGSLFSHAQKDRLAVAWKISQPLKIDGNLDESSWQEAPVIRNFTQLEPDEEEPGTETTEVRILYDDRFIYFGIICSDSQADRMVANEMRRDAELKDNDFFEIFIDTYHDHRNAFYFMTNPLGAKRDALIRDDGSNINMDWDGIWHVRTQRSNNGWVAEIAIPFQTLRFKNLDEQTWGLNMGRQVARRREVTFWSPILRNFGYFGKFKVSYFGHLQGLWYLEQGSRVQIMPYVIGGGLQEDRDSSFSRSADLGLDLKYRLTSNMTADITVNTDFAQVEADQEQFNLTRFSLFFPEKRGFFLEGADIFRVGEKFRPFEPQASLLFFSRTIGLSGDGKVIPVMGGIRVTGKTGLFDFGILNILTDRLTYGTGEDLSHIERTNFSVFRLKRAVFQKSAFGIMLLSKDSLDGPGYNRGAALDFNLAFGRSLKIEGFAAKTFSPDMKEKDYSANIDISWDSDLLGFMLSYTDIGENFNAEMGFIPRTDIRKYRGKVSIGPRPKFLNLRKSVFLYNLNYIEDHSGRLESRNDMLGVFNLFQNGSMLFFGYIRNYEYLADGFEIRENVLIHRGGHRFNMFTGFYESDRSKKISIRAETNIGQFYNGRLFRVSATAGLKLNKHLNLECIYNRNGFDLPVAEGKFATNIAAARIIYSFSPGLFAKAYLQYNDNDDKLKVNFLVRWIYKPGANVYLIYNETREVGIHHLIHDRVLMLKVSFLFNL